MATLTAARAPDPTAAAGSAGGYANTANLSTGQTGNGVSTNVIDRGGQIGPALLKLTTTVGATPTCTYALEVSPDGVAWFAAAYSDAGTPTTVAVATFAKTTAATFWYVIRTEIPWRFFRISYSANTNVTNTADLWTF